MLKISRLSQKPSRAGVNNQGKNDPMLFHEAKIFFEFRRIPAMVAEKSPGRIGIISGVL
jgi:hypothetical protein